MKKEKRRPGAGIRKQIREHRSTFVVYVILRIFVVAAMILSLLRGDYHSFFVCSLVLVLFMLPFFVQSNFGIELPSTLEIIILLFIFAAEILGELASYYIRFKYWDVLLHGTTGFLAAAVGFSMVDVFNRNERFKFSLSPAFLAVVAFCFSMTIGVLWEFFEFGMDWLFDMDMQKDTVIHAFHSTFLDGTKSNIPIPVENIRDVAVNGESLGINGYLDIGLMDTMKDLFVNFVGAVVFSIIGFFYVKTRGKGKFARRFIPTLAGEKKAEGVSNRGEGEN